MKNNKNNPLIIRIVKNVFFAAMLFIGVNIGMCVKVFMVRGVPVMHAGGELLLLLAIPASVAAGFNMGVKYANRRRRRR